LSALQMWADRLDRDGFVVWLRENGAEIMEPTSEYEIARWRTRKGVSVVYKNRHNVISAYSGMEAEKALDCFLHKKPWRACKAVKYNGRNSTKRQLLLRDGENCFYCNKPLGEDMTLEHLVPRTAKGPHHMANLVLAHEACNREATTLSVAEKVRLRESLSTRRKH
jgi:5-methylcytosine-specific restriction endonuclease McrA